jgi:hypothetical protein
MSTASKIPAPDSPQYTVFETARVEDARPQPRMSVMGRTFVTGNPHQIFLGTVRLEGFVAQRKR